MKIVVNTNILLDLFLDRKLFSDEAAELISLIDSGSLEGALVATTVTTIHYFLEKYLDTKQALKILNRLCGIFEILPVNRNVIEMALSSKLPDFEGAIIHEAACLSGAQTIITRNAKHFKKSGLAVHSAKEFLSIIEKNT